MQLRSWTKKFSRLYRQWNQKYFSFHATANKVWKVKSSYPCNSATWSIHLVGQAATRTRTKSMYRSKTLRVLLSIYQLYSIFIFINPPLMLPTRRHGLLYGHRQRRYTYHGLRMWRSDPVQEYGVVSAWNTSRD